MIAAHKSENPAATGFSAEQNTNERNSSPYREHEAMTIAQLAMKGHTVTRGTNTDYFVGKWGLIRHCPDYAALVSFALQVGGNHG